MKKTALTLLMTGAAVFMLNAPVQADTEIAKTAAYGYDSYSCSSFVELDMEKAASVLYYIRGHYDSKHDIWADYEPAKETLVFEEDFYIPVEHAMTYCKENPKNTVVQALVAYNN